MSPRMLECDMREVAIMWGGGGGVVGAPLTYRQVLGLSRSQTCEVLWEN